MLWINVILDVLALKREKFIISLGDDGKITKIPAFNIYTEIYNLYITYTGHVFVIDFIWSSQLPEIGEAEIIIPILHETENQGA